MLVRQNIEGSSGEKQEKYFCKRCQFRSKLHGSKQLLKEYTGPEKQDENEEKLRSSC